MFVSCGPSHYSAVGAVSAMGCFSPPKNNQSHSRPQISYNAVTDECMSDHNASCIQMACVTNDGCWTTFDCRRRRCLLVHCFRTIRAYVADVTYCHCLDVWRCVETHEITIGVTAFPLRMGRSLVGGSASNKQPTTVHHGWPSRCIIV